MEKAIIFKIAEIQSKYAEKRIAEYETTKEEARELAKIKVKEKLKENNKNIIDISKVIIRNESSDKNKISLDLSATEKQKLKECIEKLRETYKKFKK